MNAANQRPRGAAKQKAHRRRNVQRNAKPSNANTSAVRLLSFTIDADTAQVVNIETLDAKGNRRELSEEEKATLVRQANTVQLEDVFERVFEAGIGCVLAEGGSDIGADDVEEDTELRHLLLTELIEHSAASHLMRDEVLSRSILDELIRHSIQSPNAAASRRTARTQAGRTSSVRTN